MESTSEPRSSGWRERGEGEGRGRGGGEKIHYELP